MINNVRANGYEIISLLGQEYNDGMQFQTRFVPDESLPEGKRIITGMIKMQVNYNGKMIQPAEIVKSKYLNTIIMARIKIDYGIDLGTTNSAIARMENGESVIKQTKNLMDTLPFFVSISQRTRRGNVPCVLA